MRAGTTKVGTMALGAFLVFMFLSGDIAYGLGGGGHHGDGRRDFPQPTAPANSNSSSPDAQQAPASTANTSIPASGNSGSSDVLAAGGYYWSGGGYHWTESCGNDVLEGGYPTSVQEPVTVPEPIGALLLGLGVIGFACIRRRFER